MEKKQKTDTLLLLYIQDMRSLGVERQEIIDNLLAGEWKEDVIMAGFEAYDRGERAKYILWAKIKIYTHNFFFVIFVCAIVLVVFMALENPGSHGNMNNASIKQSIGNARSQAEIFYNRNNYSYALLCKDETVMKLMQAVRDSNGGRSVVCETTDNAYVISAEFPPLHEERTTYWCVDSTGNVGAIEHQISTGELACPIK